MKVLLTATVQSHICQFHKPLVEMLKDTGNVEIHVAARNNLGEKNGLTLDFVDKVFDVPFARSPKSTDNVKAYRQLKRIIDNEHYDIIHCNTPMGGVVTRLAAWNARNRGTKVFYTAHGFHFYKGAPKINWIVYYPIERLLAKLSDKIITINEEDFFLAQKKLSSKVYHIHGVGVDAERFSMACEFSKQELKRKHGFESFQKIILCVGELLPNKNQKMAIEAMKLIVDDNPETILLLAGNGSEEENLRTLINTNNLNNNVCFLGYVTNLEEYQKVSDLALSCSIREGLGLNIIEAMLSGNPIVATENRGHNELVIDGRNGFLVSQGDVLSMVKKISTILNDDALRMQFGEAGRTIGLQYSDAVVKEELKHIYFGE